MTNDLSGRSNQPEKMDGDQVSTSAFHRAVRELSVINEYLGGWQTSIEGVRRLLPHSRSRFSLLDVGTGGGDVAAVLHETLSSDGYRPRTIGMDRSEDSIAYARSHYGSRENLRFIKKDVNELRNRTFDIVHASLFLHHFSTSKIPDLLNKLYQISRRGLVINDLHRHPLALYSIQWLTGCFSRSELVRHDAPLSVRRSFTKDEFRSFGESADLPAPRIRWHWAFRWRVIFPHDQVH